MKKTITISIDVALYELLKQHKRGISGAIQEALQVYLGDYHVAPEERAEKLYKVVQEQQKLLEVAQK